jgi:hypothetical protein
MSLNPTGPISAEEMQRIAELPYGKAVTELRKHDPLWGRSSGEAFPWRVRFVETVQMEGFVTVQAKTEKEAIEAAEALAEAGKVTCDNFISSDDMDLDYAEPA